MVLSFIRSIGRMPLHQLFIVTLVGVTSGVYIYKPLLERYVSEHGTKKEDSATIQAAVEAKSTTSAQKKDRPSENSAKEKAREEKASGK